MKRVLVVVVVAAFACGCGSGETASVQTELDNVASCFFASVSVLQREPDNGNLGEFLSAARSKLEHGTREGEADFTRLRWSADGKRILTSSGAEVLYRRGEREHDNRSDGTLAFFTTYEFFVGRDGPSAKTTIELSIGTLPE